MTLADLGVVGAVVLVLAGLWLGLREIVYEIRLRRRRYRVAAEMAEMRRRLPRVPDRPRTGAPGARVHPLPAPDAGPRAAVTTIKED